MGQAITITAIDDFTEFPTAKRTVDVTATGGGTLQYRVEAVGRLPYGIRVEPTDLTDLVSGTSKVTITNPGRRIVVVNVRVTVTDGTREAQEEFKAVFSDNVAPFVKPTLKARSGDGAVELTWSHAGGQRVTGYQYKQGNGAWTAVPDSNADTVSHVVTGLTNGTEYTFQVRALNALGMSPESEMASATPAVLAATLPAVANLQTRVDRNWVTLTWDRSTVGVGADLSYQYGIVGVHQTTISIPNSDATTTSFTLELLPGTHILRIRTQTSRSSSRFGVNTNVTVTVEGPAAPTGLRADVGDGEVTLRWTQTTDEQVGAYEYRVNGGRWETARGVRGDGTEFRIAGLTNGVEYTFELRARGDWYGVANSNYGYGPHAEVKATLKEPLPLLPAPTDLAVKARTLTSFTVQWTAVANATGYVATARRRFGGTTVSVTVTATEAEFTGLTANTAYNVSVHATGDGTNHQPTGRRAPLLVRTAPPPPRPPDGLSIEAGDAEVTLRWTQATDTSITGYEYRQRTDSDFADAWVVISNSGASTVSHTVTSLTNGAAYAFELRAVNATGVGASSPPVREVPLAVPMAPANVTAEPGVAEVTLRWTRAADTSITGYEYTRDGGTTWVAFPSGSVHYRVTGLTNGQSYAFQLRALNVRGAGAASAVVMATPEAVPGVPGNLQAEADDGQMTLTWEAPTSGGGVKRYQLWRTGAEIWTDIAGSDAMTRSHVVMGLSNGQSYTFQVRAANDVAIGSSAEVLATPAVQLPALSIADASVDEGNSGTVDMEFTVTLGEASSEVVTVTYATFLTPEGTATAGTDYMAANGILTFAVGETMQTFTVLITGDMTGEPDETFTVSLSGPSNAMLADDEAIGTIRNDEASPTLSIAPSNVSVLEGNGSSTEQIFMVAMSPANSQEVTVAYATADGTATAADTDYTAASGTLTFAAGETRKTLTVQVTGDTVEEDDETFTVALSNASGSGALISTTAGTATVTITDDDQPLLSIADASVNEGDSGTTSMGFTVMLNRASGRRVTVDYATADIISADAATEGTDYTAANGTLTFAPNETVQTFTVPVNGDEIYEGNETFMVTLSRPAGAELADGMATGTITNDEASPTLSLAPINAPVSEGGSGTTTEVSLTVTMSPASDQRVTVGYTTAAGSATANTDYVTSSGTLTFAASETTKTIAVQVTGDDDDEGDETFTVRLSSVSGSDASISTMAGTATVTITELPTLSIANAGRNEGDSRTADLSFTVTLSEALSQPVTVDYATSDGTATAGTDYTTTTGTLTFAANDTTRTFNVSIIGDVIYEADETFMVALSNPPSGARLLAAGTTATGTITNDEATPTLRITPSNASVSEGGNGTTTETPFTVTMSPASSQPVTVAYATADGTATVADADYTAANGTLTFAAGETGKTITVQVNGDDDDEDDETFTVRLSNASGSNASISTTAGTATVAIVGLPTLSVADASMPEGDRGNTPLSFTATLMPASDEVVTVNYATSDGSASAGTDYTTTTGTLTFAAGVVTQTFTVPIIGDVIYEADETFTVALSGPSSGARLADATATGTITNDEDSPGLNIGDASTTEGSLMAFTVTLMPVSSQPVTVDYMIEGVTAIENTDYIGTSGTLAFAPGETSKTITAQIILDELNDEGEETFTVTLSGPTNAELADSEATGTIEAIQRPEVVRVRFSSGDDLGEDNSYNEGELIGVDVEFSVDIDYDGTPTIELLIEDSSTGTSGSLTLAGAYRTTARQTDGPIRHARAERVLEDGKTLRFRYQVQPEDMDSDGIRIGPDSLRGDIWRRDHPLLSAILGHDRDLAPASGPRVDGSKKPESDGQRFKNLIEEVESRNALAIVDDVIRTISQRIRDMGTSGQATLNIAGHEVRLDLQEQEEPSERRELSVLGEEETYTDLKPTTEQLFDGTSFVLPLRLNAGASNAAEVEVWGRGSWQSMDGDGDRLDWDGDRRGAQLGIDAQFREEVLGGLVVSWSDGEFDYRDGDREGRHDNRMLSVHPWIAWSTNEDIDLWASVGYGDGEITISEGDYKSDTTLQTLAAGASGPLLEQDALTVVLKGEGFFAKVDIDEGGVPDVDANRMRLAVEGSWGHGTDSGGQLTPSLELGMRADGGDGSSGTGAEIGAGVVFVDHTGRLSLDLDGRVLVTDGDVLERGLSGVLRYAPDSAGRGLSLDVRSSWGAASSGMERLWETGVSDLAEEGLQAVLGTRMQAEIGYGIGYASGLLKSYGGIELEEDGDVRYLIGSRYTTSSSLELSFEGSHQAEDSEGGIMLKGTLLW